MKYMVDTIIKHVVRETDRNSGILRFVLPSYPPELLMEIGCKLEEEFYMRRDSKIELEYGIAYRLGREWQNGTDNEKACFSRICSEGWYNETDNLTSLRNAMKPEDCECLVILLAGYEHINDQGSLHDFFHLNQQAVWEICLGKTFQGWVNDCLGDYINLDDDASECQAISNLFEALYENGLSHVLNVSTFLEQQDFSKANTGREAYKIVLEGLPFFHLPPMPSLVKYHTSRRNFTGYIAPAQEFFNYGMFLNDAKRRKALRNIEDFREEQRDEQPDQGVLGSFELQPKPLEAFLDSLEAYVRDRSEAARTQLKTVDFIYLYERVLGYKRVPSNTEVPRPRTPGAKRLTGLPPEVFLRALWITLGDFRRQERDRSILTAEDIHQVSLVSMEFRHDLDSVDNDDDSYLPEIFLRQLLGGIDEFMVDQVRLQLSADPNEIAKVNSRLAPGDENTCLVYRRHSTAEPQLKFQITISTSNHGKPFVREFNWALPQYHQSRLLIDFYEWASDEYEGGSASLPVYAVPYISEMFMARDEESMNRIAATALQSRKRFMVDLLKVEGIDRSDDITRLLLELSRCHQMFVQEVCDFGFFSALSKKYDLIRKAYCRAFEAYLKKSDESVLGPLLMKAFMVVPEHNSKDPGWAWNEYLEGGLVTPLHPALLEMIRNQHAFLCESFCYYVREGLQEPAGRMFTEKRWDGVAELSTIKWPIFGILSDLNLTLNTNAISHNYIHLVGQCSGSSSTITSTLLLQDEGAEEDEEITDVDLFRETRSSELIKRSLLDYRKIHRYADDGINIGVYCGSDMQPIIAGIDAYLAEIAKERDDRPYSLRLTVFSDSKYDSAFLRWVNAWKARWQEAESSTSKRHYSNCIISLAYRVVSTEDSFGQLERLLRDSTLDVMFFFDFIRSSASSFDLVDQDYLIQDDYRKFPVLEKICCRVSGGGMDTKRRRILSNHRFRLGALHAEVMARISRGSRNPTEKHVVTSTSDFQPWICVIDVAHKRSAWVVCIDPCLDAQLLAKPQRANSRLREIIGFGAGVGSHGENNYTISTEQFSMKDIASKIAAQISQLFKPMEYEVAKRVAESLIDEAQHIGGLSIVKATGPSHYVRDYVAYAMVRKLLPRDDNAFCDEIISLDAFWHWFDNTEDHRRPDLLRLHARIVDGYFDIKAHIVECKLAQQSEGYLEKAREQIENGLKQLVPRFRPREMPGPVGIDNRMPDQRFWWMQLHRLIAGKGTTSKPNYKDTLKALERLSDGFFNITWQATAVAFWTDLETATLNRSPEWQFSLDDQEMTISVATAGKGFITRACLENATGDLSYDDSSLAYKFVRPVEEPVVIDRSQSDEVGREIETLDIPEKTAPLYADKATQDYNEIDDRLSRQVPDRILLGRFTRGNREVYWEFGHTDLPNRHMIVFGASGTGKTYTIQALLWELARAGQNSLIVDYTNGFSTGQLEPMIIENLRPVQHIVRTAPVPINPFRRQCDYIDDQPLPETSAGVARRVSDLFAGVYDLGDQQRAALYNAIRDGVDEEGDKFNLSGLINRLENVQYEGGPTAASAATLLSKIRPFVDMNPFGEEDEESWEKLYTDVDSRCHIIQLAGFTRDSARLITEFSLFDFYWYYRANGNKDRPRVVVLDEIQNLDHRLDSPLGQLLTEGRKFGISLILATQTMSNLGKDERDRLFQASHKLFFKPADTEVRSFAQVLADSTNRPQAEWIERLSSLNRGECYSLGHSLDGSLAKLEVGKSFKIRVKSLEDRI